EPATGRRARNPDIRGDGHVPGAADEIPKPMVVALLRAHRHGTIIDGSFTPLNPSRILRSVRRRATTANDDNSRRNVQNVRVTCRFSADKRLLENGGDGPGSWFSVRRHVGGSGQRRRAPTVNGRQMFRLERRRRQVSETGMRPDVVVVASPGFDTDLRVDAIA